MAQRRKKTLEERQIEMKADNQGITPKMVAFQFKKGALQLYRRKGVKQKAQEMLDYLLDVVVPDDWLLDGLEVFRGRRLTFTQAILFRKMYHAVTGLRNPSSRDQEDLINRMLGKVPLVVKRTDGDDEEFLDLTDEELTKQIAELAERVRIKRLPIVTGEKVEKV